jgi:hypothetical protein
MRCIDRRACFETHPAARGRSPEFVKNFYVDHLFASPAKNPGSIVPPHELFIGW